jgi:hypothetical protein
MTTRDSTRAEARGYTGCGLGFSALSLVSHHSGMLGLPYRRAAVECPGAWQTHSCIIIIRLPMPRMGGRAMMAHIV